MQFIGELALPAQSPRFAAPYGEACLPVKAWGGECRVSHTKVDLEDLGPLPGTVHSCVEELGCATTSSRLRPDIHPPYMSLVALLDVRGVVHARHAEQRSRQSFRLLV